MKSQNYIKVVNIYDCTLLDSNVPAASFSDVMSIFSDKTWYNNNVNRNQQIIHMISYGIYQKGYDHWLKLLEAELLKEKKFEILQQTYSKRGANFVHASPIALGSNAMKNSTITHSNSNDEYIQIHEKSSRYNSISEDEGK